MYIFGYILLHYFKSKVINIKDTYLMSQKIVIHTLTCTSFCFCQEKDTATNSPTASSPLQSPEGESNENKMRKADTHYPRSPSPRYSPRDQKQTLPQDEPQSDEEDSPVSMGNNGKSGKTADDEDDENYDDDYEMSEDQKQAMMELQNMKLDLAYTGKIRIWLGQYC